MPSRLTRRAAVPRARSVLAGVLLGLLATIAVAGPAGATRGLTLGFTSIPVSRLWSGRAYAAGGRIVRVAVTWSAIAPARRPKDFVASDPASPGYDWTTLDGQVEGLASAGLRVMLTVDSAPRWAEGPRMPRSAAPGTWRPSASAFGSFARAIALRYDGSFPDPSHPGAVLPRVRLWQGWNEPNLSTYISPQWVRGRGRWIATSPGIFRALDDAFYTAVKHVRRSNFVVMAGTAPFGDPPGGPRIPPVAFLRDLFCLQGRVALRPLHCPARTDLDALDHHPYGVGSPTTKALNPDDASVPDIHKLTRVLRAAERDGHVYPSGPKSVWVTEISWDSDPPDPHGVPLQTQARYLEQALYILWSQGVSTVLWLQIVDSPPIPNYASTYQAGLYYDTGRAKQPTLTAYRFPLVAQRLSRDRVRIWGRAPAGGALSVEQRSRSGWHSIWRSHVGPRTVFQTTVTLRGRQVVRATVGANASLAWTVAS